MTVKISCENTTTRSAKNEVEFISLRCVLLILPDRKTKTNTLNGLWDGEIYCKRSVLSIDIECSKARSQLSLSGGHPGRCDTAVEKDGNSPLFQKHRCRVGVVRHRKNENATKTRFYNRVVLIWTFQQLTVKDVQKQTEICPIFPRLLHPPFPLCGRGRGSQILRTCDHEHFTT